MTLSKRLQVLVGVAATLACTTPPPAGAVPASQEVVFVSPASPSELAIVDRGGELRVLDPDVVDVGWIVEGNTYRLNWEAAKARYARDNVEALLEVREGKLLFAGKAVLLPSGLKARYAWQGIRWKGWILVLGRTSKTDNEANATPPYIANELIAFREDGSGALVRWLAPVASSRTLGLIVVEASPASTRRMPSAPKP